MSGPLVGLALGQRELVVARRTAGSAPATAWRRTLAVALADSPESQEELRAALAEMRETLETPSARLAVALLPSLVQVRVLRFPRLSVSEIRRVVTRDVSKYFPGVRDVQVVAVAPLAGARGGPTAVLAAAAPAWVLDTVSEAARAAGCDIASFEPAHSGWATWARLRGASVVVVEDGERAELIRAGQGKLLDVRRTPANSERIAAGLGELGEAAPLRFGAAEFPEAAAIAACSAGSSLQLELVSAAEAVARARRTRRMASRLWVAAAASLVLALGMHRAALLRELAVLERGRAAQRVAVEAALSTREASLGVQARLDALARAAAEAPSWTAILNQVAAGLPGDAYLTSLRGTADSVVIDGVAGRAAGVFEGLQSATRLSGVRPAGPIRQEVRDSGPPIERFTASATLVRTP